MDVSSNLSNLNNSIDFVLDKAPSYTSLHNHSHYSNIRLRDSINTIRDLVLGGSEKGLNGIAITDHEILSGHFDMLNLQKKYVDSNRIDRDYVVILGNEIYLVDDLEKVKEEGSFYHFILLSKNKTGEIALRKLTNQSWDNMFVRGGMERVPITKEQLQTIMKDYNGKGNIVGSTACLGSELAQNILDILMYEIVLEIKRKGLESFKNDNDEFLILSRFIPNLPSICSDKWKFLKLLNNSHRDINEEYQFRYLKDEYIKSFFVEVKKIKENEVMEKMNNHKRAIDNYLKWGIEVFGKDDFYIEIQPSLGSEQVLYNRKAIEIANAYGLEYLVTTDSHFLDKEDISLQEAFLTSSEGDREVMSFYVSCYIHTPHDLVTKLLHGGLQEEEIIRAMQNTNIIKAQCKNHLDLNERVHIPTIDDIDMSIVDLTKIKEVATEYENIMKFANSDYDTDRYMLYIIQEGMRIKNQEWNRANLERIDIELYEMWEVGNHVKQHMSDYHITVRELINIMWEEGESLVGVSRGSASGFYTLYLLDIVQMNPLEHDLPHWRYMHHSKPSLAD